MLQIGWTALLSVASSQQGQAPPELTEAITEVAEGELQEVAHPVPEVVIAGPVPVINVLEPLEEPITASLGFTGHQPPAVESLPYHPSLRRRVVGGARRAVSAAKFW